MPPTSAPSAGSVFHALLIGAEFYFENRLPNGGYYPSLHGCVSDVIAVEAMLRERVGKLPATTLAVTKLLASNQLGSQPPEDPASWPTAANIRKALDELVGRVRPGDQVYIHCSSHGGRSATRFPELKGRGGVDESLVPIDIGGGAGTCPERYIRDVELVNYLTKLAKKTDDKTEPRVSVSLVLDACHSGGAVRGVEVAQRCASGGQSSAQDPAGTLDTRPLEAASADPPPDLAELQGAWSAARAAAGARAAALTSWLPQSDQYVLLAACRDTEGANEARIDGQPPGGVMTGAFLAALRQLGTDQSWQTVYDLVLAQVQSRFPAQTPQLLGQRERQIFGVRLLPMPSALTVLAIDPARRWVKLDAGLAHGLKPGAEVGIYRRGTTDFSLPEAQVAVAVVIQVDASQLWAKLADDVAITAVEAGLCAMLLSLPIRRKVTLRHRDDLPARAAATQEAALAAVAAALTTGGRGFLALSPATETPSYQVVVNPNQEYELWDPQGRPLAGMQPPLRIDEPHAAETVVTRLLRLARFHLIAEICASPSELAAQVQVELLRDAPDQPAPVFCAPVGDAYEFPSGTTALLRIRNGSARAINVACLDLQCDWGISMVVPSKETTSAPYETLGPSESKSFVLQFYLPPGYESTLDVLKVIITVGHADCRWFEQDAIGAPPRSAERGGQERGPANHALERLIAMTEVKENSTRHVISASAPGAEWTVRQLRVLVRNPAQ